MAKPKPKAGARVVTGVHVQIGQRIRAARLACKMSQAELAEQLGLTFQQVQKYEKGTNRVDSSRMMQIARILGVQLADLLGDISVDEKPNTARDNVTSMLGTREGVQVLSAMFELNPAQRQFLVDVARRLPRLASAGA